MEIYLLRHGQAEDRAPGKLDSDRKLTAKGKRDVQAVLKIANIDPEQIYTSGLRRADESAALLHRPTTVTANLAPSADPAAIWTEIRAKKHDRVLLLGHDPHLSNLVSYLLGAPIAIDFKKGAIIRIDASKELPGTLRWMLTPRLARTR